jgi:adenine deaminase
MLMSSSSTDSSVGFHGTALGISVHHELSMYVNHCGFSPIQALRSAISITVRRYNLADRGRIVMGLAADLLLVRGGSYGAHPEQT